MNGNQTEANISETTEDNGLGSDADLTRFVPVTESIRYRRRAQSAEKKAESLAEQLAEANEKITEMSHSLDHLQVEQQLTRMLVAAGVTDLEAAVLMAKARMEGKSEADIDNCVKQLRDEKSYLFGGSVETVTSRKTAGVKDRLKRSETVLERAAKKAARTASRADLHEYLKLRRNLL
jgi:hypothetical protein